MLDLLATINIEPLLLPIPATLPLGVIMGILGGLFVLNKGRMLSDYSVIGALIGALITYLIFGMQVIPYVFASSFIFALLSMLLAHILRITKFSQSNIVQPLLSAILFGIAVIIIKAIEIRYSNIGFEINSLIFGDANLLTNYETMAIWYTSICVFIIILLSFKPIKIILVDIDFAKTVRVFVSFYATLMLLVYTAVVTVGLQSIGAIFFIPVLIMPAISAKLVTKNSGTMLIVSGLFGLLSAFSGNFLSDNYVTISTGMGMTMSAFAIMVLAIIISKLFMREKED